MYLCNRNILTDLENEIMVVRGKKKGEEVVREFGINMHTFLYLKWVSNKNLLYNTGNSARLCDSLDRGWGRDLEENEYTYMYGWVSLLSIWNYHNIVNHLRVHAKSLQSCSTLCNPMDHSSSGSSVHGAGSQHRSSHPWQGHAGEPWWPRRVRTRGAPWICLSIYPKTRICLFYYFMTFTNSSDINGGLSLTTFLWRKST